MEIQEERFRPILVTKGRKTGNSHAVWLRAVKYNGKIYFSRHRPDGDWFQNAIANAEVKIQYKDMEFIGNASIVTDEKLNAESGDEKNSEVNLTVKENKESTKLDQDDKSGWWSK